MKRIPIIKTNRLILRPFIMKDAINVQKLAGEKIIASTTLNIPYPYEDGMAEKWISIHPEQFEKGNLACFAIELHDKKTLIGAVSLSLKQSHERGELGYWIGVPYWGNGYCTEASKEILKYGFCDLRLNRIEAFCMSRNHASIRVLKKIGMSIEGYLRQYVKKWGIFEDYDVYSIIFSEYTRHFKDNIIKP